MEKQNIDRATEKTIDEEKGKKCGGSVGKDEPSKTTQERMKKEKQKATLNKTVKPKESETIRDSSRT